MERSLSRLQTFHGALGALPLLRAMILDEFKGEICLVSSFGAGSALLLALVAEVNPETPVLFLDTEKHFPETLEYVETLRHHLDLKGLKILRPDPKLVGNIDASGELWKNQPNRCCWLRKVEPQNRALKEGGYTAIITGRKRYQTKQRGQMDTVELHEDGRFRINPLAHWSKEEIVEEFKRRNLPEHPLVARGYLSIGCAPCTRPVKEGENERAGRWAHTAELPGGEHKQECGIHSPVTPDWTL